MIDSKFCRLPHSSASVVHFLDPNLWNLKARPIWQKFWISRNAIVNLSVIADRCDTNFLMSPFAATLFTKAVGSYFHLNETAPTKVGVILRHCRILADLFAGRRILDLPKNLLNFLVDFFDSRHHGFVKNKAKNGYDDNYDDHQKFTFHHKLSPLKKDGSRHARHRVINRIWNRKI